MTCAGMATIRVAVSFVADQLVHAVLFTAVWSIHVLVSLSVFKVLIVFSP